MHAHGVDDALGQRLRVGHVRIRQQHRERFAADPARRLPRTDRADQRRTQRGNHRIAPGVPEPVVERLETIDIDHQQRAARAAAPGLRHRKPTRIGERAPGGQTVQRIDACEPVELLGQQRRLAQNVGRHPQAAWCSPDQDRTAGKQGSRETHRPATRHGRLPARSSRQPPP